MLKTQGIYQWSNWLNFTSFSALACALTEFLSDACMKPILSFFCNIFKYLFSLSKYFSCFKIGTHKKKSQCLHRKRTFNFCFVFPHHLDIWTFSFSCACTINKQWHSTFQLLFKNYANGKTVKLHHYDSSTSWIGSPKWNISILFTVKFSWNFLDGKRNWKKNVPFELNKEKNNFVSSRAFSTFMSQKRKIVGLN
jgi:hypothetical protein